MGKLLILADDLTGALDSGVQLTGKGARVLIRLKTGNSFGELEDLDVLVINTDTRHENSRQAYQTVYTLVSLAKKRGFDKIYKKTDSGLRGNVGSELKAALDASGEPRLHFIPAYPKLGRVTKNGIQYVNGKPLEQSIFAQDPIDPVDTGVIADLIHERADVPVLHGEDTFSAGEEDRAGIVVYDAGTQEDLVQIRNTLSAKGEDGLIAGCAGFLDVYPSVEMNAPKCSEKLPGKLLVLSGSVNAVTKKQLDIAEQGGGIRLHIPMDEVLDGHWEEEQIHAFAKTALEKQKSGVPLMIDTLGEIKRECTAAPATIGRRIAKAMGHLAKELLDMGGDFLPMTIGGDTLQGLVEELELEEMRPLREIDPGSVLTEFDYAGKLRHMITKSGAFGEEDLLLRIAGK